MSGGGVGCVYPGTNTEKSSAPFSLGGGNLKRCFYKR